MIMRLIDADELIKSIPSEEENDTKKTNKTMFSTSFRDDEMNAAQESDLSHLLDIYTAIKQQVLLRRALRKNKRNGEGNKMTKETYETATKLMAKISALNDSIRDIEYALESNYTEHWLMEIREAKTCPLNEVDHKGLLPEFLKMILAKLYEERAELEKELEEL